MNIPLYQVDAFTKQRFAGNPAAVMPLPAFLPDETMQQIAAENNLAETAFLVLEGEDYQLRWFTPVSEVPLCGHATLGSGAVVMERLEPERTQVIFHTASGALTVTRLGEEYVMNFPARPSEQIFDHPALTQALGAKPCETWVSPFNYMAIFDEEEALRALSPDMRAVAQLDRPGVIVSARGSGSYDFVSRYFAPAKGIPEDPVTGSAHCMLAPYWAKVLDKTSFRAFQASARGGEVICRLKDNRVELQGSCVFYLEGTVQI